MRIPRMSVSQWWGCPIRQVLFAPVWSLVAGPSRGTLARTPHPSKQTTTIVHPSSTHQMAIAPITGKLRKRFWVDLTTALGLGVGAGYAYWFVFSDTRLSPSRGMLTRHTSGMESISRAVSPSTCNILFFDEYADSDPFLVQKQEEFYYKLEQAKKAES